MARRSLRARVAIAAMAIAVLTSLRSPAAATPRLKLDRVEAEPAWFFGRARLRLYVTAVTLEGARIEIPPDAWELELTGTARTPPPIQGAFAGAHAQELVLALVVETGFDFSADLGAIRENLVQLLAAAPRNSRGTLIEYGEGVQGGRVFEPVAKLSARVERSTAESSPADNRLIDAMERALDELARVQPSAPGAPMRKVVIVVSDGKDIDPEPARYRAIGERAARAGVRIHSLAYSPVDNRRPLLGLGEMSKRSRGTFRWVRSRDGFATQFKTLVDELALQYVLTYFLPADGVADKRVKVRYKDLESEEVRIGPLACGGTACKPEEYCAQHRCVERDLDRGPGWLGWILYVIGGGVVLLLGLSAIGYWLHRRDAQRKRAAAAAGASGLGPRGSGSGTASAGGHRIVPRGWDGNVVDRPPGGASGLGPQASGSGTGVASGPRPEARGPRPEASPAAGAASLYIVAGPGQGTTLPLQHGFVIGSSRNCHLILAGDREAAPIHAQIVMDTAGNCTLIDRGSSAGTFVNGVRATQTPLRHGMLIRIGAAELRFLKP